MSPNPNLTTTLVANIPHSTQTTNIWTATSLTLKRNLARFHFPSKMTVHDKEQSLLLLKELLLNLSQLESFQYFDEGNLSPSDKELIYEHFLFLRGFQQNLSGNGLFIDQKGTALALLNSGNHFELRILCPGGTSDPGWDKLFKIEAAIGKKAEFAFSPKFGYLTSDPTQCGTGLIVQAYLHLPALIHMNQLERLLPKETEELLVLGLAGSLEQPVGDWIILKNAYTLGMTEEAILQSIQTSSTKLVGAEKALRLQLKEKGDPSMKDLISKAYGVLLHAYQLEIKEALNSLNLVKLGIDLGWITGVSNQKIGELFFKCRRGHLSHLFPELAEQTKDLEHKRAEFLHKELQGLQLGATLQ
jgi:protein arginine kinase